MGYVHRVANFTCTGSTIQIHHFPFSDRKSFISCLFPLSFLAATKECELQTTVGVRLPVCALNLTDTNVEQM